MTGDILKDSAEIFGNIQEKSKKPTEKFTESRTNEVKT